MIILMRAKAEKAVEKIHSEFLKVRGQEITQESLVTIVATGKQPFGTLQLKLRLGRTTIANHEPKKGKEKL